MNDIPKLPCLAPLAKLDNQSRLLALFVQLVALSYEDPWEFASLLERIDKRIATYRRLKTYGCIRR